MAGSPKASSTPKLVDVKGRPSIRGDESVQSPITERTYQHALGQISGDELEHSNAEESEEHQVSKDTNYSDDDESDKIPVNTTFCNCLSPLVITVIVLLIAMLISLHYTEILNNNPKSVKTSISKILSDKFPSQLEDFWLSVEVAINDINKFNQPKSIIFLYQNESAKTMKNILYELTNAALPKITSCTSCIPIILEASDFSTEDILEDYGKIIARNKAQLQKSGIMIIKNLEKIPGTSAQAFHSLCDEYNPVVEKVLFLFTMNVPMLPKNNKSIDYIERYLQNYWNDLKYDKFYPLFTRISNIVLQVTTER